METMKQNLILFNENQARIQNMNRYSQKVEIIVNQMQIQIEASIKKSELRKVTQRRRKKIYLQNIIHMKKN